MFINSFLLVWQKRQQYGAPICSLKRTQVGDTCANPAEI